MDALPALEFVDRPAAAFAAEVRGAGNRKSGEAELCDTTGMHVDHAALPISRRWNRISSIDTF